MKKELTEREKSLKAHKKKLEKNLPVDNSDIQVNMDGNPRIIKKTKVAKKGAGCGAGKCMIF